MERSTWNQDKAEHIIQKLMLSNDAFSQWMGIEVVEISPISVILSMVITEEMTNGFGIAHGGIIYPMHMEDKPYQSKHLYLISNL